ncbi:MAG: hypothetical protein M5U26_11605 [Planctomycetota bacterium]|nr:hypothetical protein [Planctomycetota bacterium]
MTIDEVCETIWEEERAQSLRGQAAKDPRLARLVEAARGSKITHEPWWSSFCQGRLHDWIARRSPTASAQEIDVAWREALAHDVALERARYSAARAAEMAARVAEERKAEKERRKIAGIAKRLAIIAARKARLAGVATPGEIDAAWDQAIAEWERREAAATAYAPVHVYKITLKKEFGLTDTLIAKLGEPDKLVRNPHYKSGPPSQLYERRRVEEFIKANRAEVEKAKQARARRKAAAEKAVKTKINATFGIVDQEGLRLLCPLPDAGSLWREAGSYYAMRYSDYQETGFNGLCAFVRHNYTNYEEVLDLIRGRVGTRDAYSHIRLELDEQVAEWVNRVLAGEEVRPEA